MEKGLQFPARRANPPPKSPGPSPSPPPPPTRHSGVIDEVTATMRRVVENTIALCDELHLAYE